jgi:hypothetical protein
MKIPFTNIVVGRETPSEPTKQAKRVADRIFKMQLYRSRQRLTEWKNAVLSAESEIYPDRTQLTELYQEVVNDLHMWSVMQTITLRVLATGFIAEKSDDVVDDEATITLRSKWFRDILKFFIESKFYGFSLVQIGGVHGAKLIDNELIPRQYVVPEMRAVKLLPFSRLAKGEKLDSKSAISFDDPVYGKWLIPLGDRSDLGLLQKTAPAIILKKEMLSAWAEFGEVFGMPFRTMYSATDNQAERAKLESMLSGMGRAAWALLDTDDKFELKETSRTDAFKVYDAFIERMNSEISKGIVGQTMTSDDGSSQSQATVHQNLLDQIVSAYLADAADTINDVVFPKLFALGVLKPGVRFAWDMERQLSAMDLIKIVSELSKLGDIPLDWISDAFDIPIDEKQIPDPIPPKVDENGDPIPPKVDENGDPIPPDVEPKPIPPDALNRIRNLYQRVIDGKR